MIPFWGDFKQAWHHASVGEWDWMMLHATLAAADLATLGGDSLVKAPIEAGIKAGAKKAGKEAGEKLVKEGAERAAKEGAEKGAEDAGKCTGKSGRPCFVAGTPIRTPEGSISIERLRAGMMVLSRPEYDPDGLVAGKVVEEVFVRRAPTLAVRIGGQAIRATYDHPVWVHGKGWVGAQMLEPGDEVRTSGERWVEVESVRETGEDEKVYNFRVAAWHTYFDGTPGWGFDVWVHNSHDTPGTGPGGHAAEDSGRYSGRYADGQKAHRTNVPRDGNNTPIPDPKARGPHTRLQRDAKDPRRIYSGTEFDGKGDPVKRIDFAGRKGDPLPHQHPYNPNTKAFGGKEPLS